LLFRYHAFFLIPLYGNTNFTLCTRSPPKSLRTTNRQLYHPPTANDSVTTTSVNRTHGSCGHLVELAASCAASTAYRTFILLLAPKFALRYTPCAWSIRIPITTLHLPTSVHIYILPWILVFPCGNHLHVPNFRISHQPTCTALHCTAPTFVTYFLTFSIKFSSQFVLADKKKKILQQSDAITSLLSLSIAAADGGALPVSALPEHTPGSGVAQSLGAANSMFATSTNTTAILPTSVGASSMAKHHRRLGSMGKTKRRLSDAREASVRPM